MLAAALITGAVTLVCTGSAQAARTHAAAIIDMRADVLAEMLPASCTYELTDDRVLRVLLGEDIGGTVALPENFGKVEFVLQGHTIAGTDGADVEGETPAALHPAKGPRGATVLFI